MIELLYWLIAAIALLCMLPVDSRGSIVYRVRCWIEARWWRFNTNLEGFERYDTGLILTLLGMFFFSAAAYGIAVYFMGWK